MRLLQSNGQNYNQFWMSIHLWPQTTSTRTDKASRQFEYTVSVILTHTELYHENVYSDNKVRGSTLFGPLVWAAGKDKRFQQTVEVYQTVSSGRREAQLSPKWAQVLLFAVGKSSGTKKLPVSLPASETRWPKSNSASTDPFTNTMGVFFFPEFRGTLWKVWAKPQDQHGTNTEHISSETRPETKKTVQYFFHCWEANLP